MALFPITIHVEESAVGPVLRLLNKYPGVAKLDLNLDAIPGPKGNKNGSSSAPSDHAQNPNGAVSAIIAELRTGQKNIAHLKAVYEAAGGSRKSTSSALNVLQRKGITEIVGHGVHKLTERALAGLMAAERQHTNPIALPAPKAQSTRDFVLDGVGHGKTRSELVTAGVAAGLTAKSVISMLNRLSLTDKLIENVSRGVYRLKNRPNKPTKG